MNWLLLPFAAVLGISACFLGVIIAQILLSYARFFRWNRKLSELPEAPCGFWRRFTLGHEATRQMQTARQEDAAAQFQDLKRIYGNLFVIRSLFGDPCVIALSASAIMHVASAKHAGIYHKTTLLRKHFGSLLGASSVLLAHGAEHARLRRIISPIFHHSAMLRLTPVFIRHAKALADALLKYDGEAPDDILLPVHECSFRLIVDACFGDQVVPEPTIDRLRMEYFSCIDEPRPQAVRRVMLQRVFSFVPSQWFGFRERVKSAIRLTLTRLVRATSSLYISRRAVAVGNVDGRSSKQSASTTLMTLPNLLSLVTSSKEHMMTEEEMVSLVMTFITAGQATTSFTVAWTLYNLATHVHWQESCRSELASWDANAEDALEVLNTFPILDRVVKETLRHDPPVSFVARKATTDDVIDGFNIPRGVTVRFPIFTIQRDPAVWGPDAHEFNPDRWLQDDVRKLAPYFLIFWHGSRSCVGQRFALLEIKAFVATVLQRASLTIRESDPKAYAMGVFNIPINMKIYINPLQSQS